MNRLRTASRALFGTLALAALMGCGVPAAPTPTPLPTFYPTPTTSLEPTLVPTVNPLRDEGAFTGTITMDTGQTINIGSHYIVDFPPGYDPSSGIKYPLQVHLHGAGGTGISFKDFKANIRRQTVVANNSARYPFIILFPQLPGNNLTWKMLADPLDKLVEKVISQYPIDIQRIYLTGYSDGGYGALAFGAKYHGRFAAVAEVSGYYDANLSELCALKDTPLYIYHGKQDQVIPLQAEQEVEQTLKGCGADMTVTLFDAADHFTIVDTVFNQPDLYTALLSHTLRTATP